MFACFGGVIDVRLSRVQEPRRTILSNCNALNQGQVGPPPPIASHSLVTSPAHPKPDESKEYLILDWHYRYCPVAMFGRRQLVRYKAKFRGVGGNARLAGYLPA